VGRVLTCLFATHANILSSVRSTTSRKAASMLDRMLLYRRAQRGNPNFQFLILKQILIFQFLNFIMFRN